GLGPGTPRGGDCPGTRPGTGTWPGTGMGRGHPRPRLRPRPGPWNRGGSMRQFTEFRPGPDGAFGVDRALEDRPGVPMEAEPASAEGVHWEEIPRQPARRTHLHRRGLTWLTP